MGVLHWKTAAAVTTTIMPLWLQQPSCCNYHVAAFQLLLWRPRHSTQGHLSTTQHVPHTRAHCHQVTGPGPDHLSTAQRTRLGLTCGSPAADEAQCWGTFGQSEHIPRPHPDAGLRGIGVQGDTCDCAGTAN